MPDIVQANYIIWESPIGKLIIEDDGCAITKILSFSCIKKLHGKDYDLYIEKLKKNSISTSLNLRAKKQLQEYFSGNRKAFNLPLNPHGTDFQKKVWCELLKVKYGEFVSYKTIAKNLGDCKKARAVGNANNKNPIIIIIPCHRVISNNGKIGGYACGLDIKKQLLDLEMNNK